MCEENGRVTPAYAVDHITPIKDGGATLDERNLQSLCSPCHNSKTAQERVGRVESLEIWIPNTDAEGKHLHRQPKTFEIMPARKPTNILKLSGAAKNHPERLKERENEPEEKTPISIAPDYLSDFEKECYVEIIGLTIDGVLTQCNSISVAMAAQLFAKCKLGEAMQSDQGLFFKYLGQFGMLPAEKSKISIAKPKKKNRFDD